MKFGDIFICRFPFTSGGIGKPRPALVLFDLGADAVICRVTSVMHASALDVPVLDWHAAGLAKPSVVRLNRIVTAEKTLLHARLGQLSMSDQQSVRDAWNTSMKL